MDTSQKRQKILIVEDHPASRKLLTNILEQKYAVLCAQNGEEGLELANQHPDIDLILLDIIMPKMNGYETCKKIKETEQLADIPIIFLTVMEEERDEVKGFEVGVSDYIIKPISRLRLLVRVENQLKIQQQKQLLEQKNNELEAALQQINVLQGILPICSFCKEIRLNNDDWQPIETFIQSRSEAEFSHSVCPKCLKKHYSELG